MSPQPRVEQFLEEALSSGRTPEEVCADAPELLDEVRERWEHVQAIEGQLRSLFPRSDESRDDEVLLPYLASGSLTDIPGYDILEVLGKGGMGIVYKAVHRSLDRRVAIKMLIAGRHLLPRDGSSSLSREAQAIAALRHPNIVQVHDVGEVDGRAYFSMEYVEGGNLAQKLDGAPIAVDQAATMIFTLARAVEAAHQSGVIHRDLKPANVLLTADGTPKVSDFGLAMRVELAGDDSSSVAGARIGTPSYMAPEQASAMHGAVGPAADVYALGAILYEMLTGRAPFTGESASETVRQLLSQEPVPPSRLNSRVPRDLETICLKCLQKDSSRRYETAAVLADDVRRFQNNEPIRARPVSLLERGTKLIRRHRAATAALAATALLLVTVLAAAIWFVSSRAAANRAANADLREAAHFLQQSDWPAANRAIDRAVMRLGNGGTRELRGRLDQARRDSALAVKLEAIRLQDRGTVSGGAVTFEQAARDYAAVLLEAGLVDPREGPDQVARRVRESNIRESLVVALDTWALSSNQGGENVWLREVIKKTGPDKDGWRDRALDLATYADPDRCRLLMADAPMTRECLPLLRLIGVQASGDEVIPFLTRVQQAFPDDFWANESLANALFDANRLSEAVAYEQAAVALRPDLAWVHYNFGGALLRMGATDRAVVQLRRAVELAPNDMATRIYLAVAYRDMKRWSDALTTLDRALQLDPKSGACFEVTGDVYRLMGRDDDAIAAYRQSLAINPDNPAARAGIRRVLIHQDRIDEALTAWRTLIDERPTDHEARDGYAEYCLFLGRTEDYNHARTELLGRFGDSKDAGICERTGRACLLLSSASDDELRRATAMIDRAVSLGVESESLSYYQFAKALAEYRAGHYEAALAMLRGDVLRVLQPAPQLLHAMVRCRLGEAREARDELAAAVGSFDWSPTRVHGADEREVWIYHILRREAEQLIGPAP